MCTCVNTLHEISKSEISESKRTHNKILLNNGKVVSNKVSHHYILSKIIHGVLLFPHFCQYHVFYPYSYQFET